MARVIMKNISKTYSSNENRDTAAINSQSAADNNKSFLKGSDIAAVKNINLEIADEEFIVMLGPSGCGKSTTLRMIAGLETITGGELYIGDRLVNNVTPKDRNIAMVFQNYAIYPHMTVYENMAFGLKLRKVKKSVIDMKVRDAADILGIASLLGRRSKTLSGGERQRVAIGRAIVREPEVFLFDEPLSNLDAKLRDQLRAEIIKLRRRLNATFIYVTHDQTEAMTLGDRIVIMKDGLIQQIGSPGEVFDMPKNLFTAGFIGTPQMNFFPAKLSIVKNEFAVRILDNVISVPDQMQKALEVQNAGKDIILGVRPEHIEIADDDSANSISAEIDFLERMGSEIYLHVKAGGNNATLRMPSKASRHVYGKERESIINITFCKNKIHLFDAETEENLQNLSNF